MAQWGKIDRANNSPKFGAQILSVGSGPTAKAANTTALYNNTTPRVFPTFNKGIVGVHALAPANTGPSNSGTLVDDNGDSAAAPHAGWNVRRAGMGPVTSIKVNAGGTGYANLAVIKITAGAGATNSSAIVLSTNSTGGIVTVGAPFGNSGGLFPNTSYITAISNLAANGVLSAGVNAHGAGYSNGDVVTFSNGTSNGTGLLLANATGNAVGNVVISIAGSGFPSNTTVATGVKSANGSATGNGVTSVTVAVSGTAYTNGDIATFSNGVINALGTITTDASGNIASVAVTNAGKGFAGPTNTAVVITAANGSATTGSGATLTPVETSATFTGLIVVSAGSGANLAVVLGGRAGRVHFETLVAMRINGVTGAVNNNVGNN